MMAVILHGQGLDAWSARVFGLADVLRKMGHLSSEVAVLSQRLRLGDVRAEVRGATWTVRNVDAVPVEPGERARVVAVRGLELDIRSERSR